MGHSSCYMLSTRVCWHQVISCCDTVHIWYVSEGHGQGQAKRTTWKRT